MGAKPSTSGNSGTAENIFKKAMTTKFTKDYTVTFDYCDCRIRPCKRNIDICGKSYSLEWWPPKAINDKELSKCAVRIHSNDCIIPPSGTYMAWDVVCDGQEFIIYVWKELYVNLFSGGNYISLENVSVDVTLDKNDDYVKLYMVLNKKCIPVSRTLISAKPTSMESAYLLPYEATDTPTPASTSENYLVPFDGVDCEHNQVNKEPFLLPFDEADEARYIKAAAEARIAEKEAIKTSIEEEVKAIKIKIEVNAKADAAETKVKAEVDAGAKAAEARTKAEAEARAKAEAEAEAKATAARIEKAERESARRWKVENSLYTSFIQTSLLDKRLDFIPGLKSHKIYRFEKDGICTAAELVGLFLTLSKDKSAFNSYLTEHIENYRDRETIIEAIDDWCEARI